MDVRGLISVGLLGLWAVWMVALATGRDRLHGVRDERDALLARWFVGAVTFLAGTTLVALDPDPIIRIAGVAVAATGAAVTLTARNRAPFDQNTRIPDTEVARMARTVTVDAAPRSREPFDVHMRWWMGPVAITFAAAMAASVGFILVLIDREPGLEPWQKVALMTCVGVPILGGMVAPALWYGWRIIRAIPVLRVDALGIVTGTDRQRDLFIAWSEIERIEVRQLAAGGMAYRALVLVPRDADRWLARHPFLARLSARFSRVMYGGLFVIPDLGMTHSVEPILARLGAFRPDLFPTPSDDATQVQGIDIADR